MESSIAVHFSVGNKNISSSGMRALWVLVTLVSITLIDLAIPRLIRYNMGNFKERLDSVQRTGWFTLFLFLFIYFSLEYQAERYKYLCVYVCMSACLYVHVYSVLEQLFSFLYIRRREKFPHFFQFFFCSIYEKCAEISTEKY